MIPVNMPVVGQDYKTGTLIEWRKDEGEAVEKGEVILVVESEKAAFDVEAEESGVLIKKLYQEGEEAEVLTPVAYIGQPGEQTEADSVDISDEDTASVKTAGEADLKFSSLKNKKIKASPVARRIAREMSVDLSMISGSGPGGRIIKKDVTALAEASDSVTPGGDREIPYSRIRRKIASRLTESWTAKPHFSLVRDVDMESAMRFREEYGLANSVKISVNDLVVFAVSRVLKDFPRLNCHVSGNGIIEKGTVNIGIAVAVNDGLFVPVIENAAELSPAEIAGKSRSLIREVRTGKYQTGQAGTFSVSNLGAHNITMFTPIINPPEAAILGIGAVERRAIARGTFLGTGLMMTVSLVCDHRAVDGLYGAQFLEAFQEVLSSLRPGKDGL